MMIMESELRALREELSDRKKPQHPPPPPPPPSTASEGASIKSNGKREELEDDLDEVGERNSEKTEDSSVEVPEPKKLKTEGEEK